MNAKELLSYEIDQCGAQIRACFSGMPESGMDTPCGPGAMSPRDLLEHLAEAYTALIASCRGEKHEWGSFSIPDKTTDNLIATVFSLRDQAVAAVLAKEDDASLKHGYDFIVGHDNYHVGQFVLSRLQVQPEWNSYEIYG